MQGLDLNQGPSGYEPDELPGCSTLQKIVVSFKQEQLFKGIEDTMLMYGLCKGLFYKFF